MFNVVVTCNFIDGQLNIHCCVIENNVFTSHFIHFKKMGHPITLLALNMGSYETFIMYKHSKPRTLFQIICSLLQIILYWAFHNFIIKYTNTCRVNDINSDSHIRYTMYYKQHSYFIE